MPLSTQFSLPNSSFDPTKYSGKSPTTTATKALSQPDSETTTMTTTSSAEKPGVACLTSNGTCSANTGASIGAKHTTPIIEDKSITNPDVETEQSIPSSSSKWEGVEKATFKDLNIVTMSDFLMEQDAFLLSPKTDSTKHTTPPAKEKPAANPDIKIEQSTCLSSSEVEEVNKTMVKDTNMVTMSEVKVNFEQQDIVLSPKIIPTMPTSGEGPACPPTILTEEMWNKAFIPPPDEPVSTSTRRLVSIRRIRNIQQAKVENRWLTLAQVDEWTSIIPRRAFREGELVVYVEIDAFLPSADERFGKMASLQTFDGELGHRVKTRRFGSHPDKLLVQGYIYPIEKFEEIYEEVKCVEQYLDNVPMDKSRREMIKRIICTIYRNRDWAVEIGVKKWEESKQVNKPDKHPKLGAIPTRVFKKTDIAHFEDCPNLFTKGKYFANEYQESIKMDGASMTVYFVKDSAKKFHELNGLPEEVGPNTVLGNGRFGVTTKNVDLNELSACAFGYWKTALKNDLPAKLSNLDRSIAIQGEICGPGINQNRERLDETQFFVSSMWDITLQKYIDPRKVEALAEKLGLKHVPVLGYVKIREIAASHDDLRNLADKLPGEGLVFKCVRDGRSFKVHSPTYKIVHDC